MHSKNHSESYLSKKKIILKELKDNFTFSAQMDTYGSTRRPIFPDDKILRNINISATKLLPALQKIKIKTG